MDLQLYQPITDGTRTDRAARLLSDLITTGKLAPGDFLPSEPVLAKQLGVSRPTLRLALRTLEMRGLVVSKRGVGVQVTDRTHEVATDSIELMLQRDGGDIRDMLELRLILECQGALLAAQRATDDDIAAIAATIEAMGDGGLSIGDCIELDLDFHVRLAEASKNTLLVALVRALRRLMLDTIAATHEIDHRTMRRQHAHALVLDAIKARDPEAAYVAMEEMLRSTEELLGVESPRRGAPPKRRSGESVPAGCVSPSSS
ncbi:MAG: FadR family transcriptional regulator [Actinomycetota bacterium]|nr:FadR family transcriptional regulator [Actinomycetota bacterium]